MKRAWMIGCVLLVCRWTLAVDAPASLPIAPIADPVKAGRELASELCAKVPAGNSEFTGVLKITPRDSETRNVPFSCLIQVGGDKLSPTRGGVGSVGGPAPAWEAIYRTKAVDGTPAERLQIVYQPGRFNEYFYARGGTAGQPPGELRRLGNEQAEVPLAGSDFWLVDLGLEFLHWPSQRVIKAGMRRSQPCRELESVNPHPSESGYARVVSWVARMDEEALGIIEAKAYDKKNQLLKEFSLGSFKKVEGQWELQDMKIRNARTGSRTWLEFDLKK